ncbi:hypothetical protein [Methanosphaera sp. WGK6]|uniref:hypothetical protein n=1 Tax=Methanosphaera sp. WGK6 TaxID=1561964 RepID=UPI00084CC89F|nr:hypothetical protein [Methanosphaera sp. WGK6]OED29521.1 hypothetical protein NL43_07800 [Methanosphaera sp. WGK6]
MDKKIILVVLIVALIGIVAATYNINTDTLANQLASVGIEDGATESATDLVAESGDSASTPTSSDSSSATTGSSNNDNSNSGNSNSNSNAQTTTSPTNKITSQNKTTNNPISQNKTTKYTISQATVLANNWMTSQSSHTTAKASYRSTFTSSGDEYYVFIFRENGKVVGEIEMNAQTGSVTGGAFEGEVNPHSNNTTN